MVQTHGRVIAIAGERAPMKLRYEIPLELFITAPTEELLGLQTSFSYRGCVVHMNITGEDRELNSSISTEDRYYRVAQSLHLIMAEEPNRNILQALISPPDYPGLTNLLRKAANRCLRAIRNFGGVSLLRELTSDDDESPEQCLRHWQVEASKDGTTWSSLVPAATFEELLTRLARQRATPQLNARKWPEVEEAIQDNLLPLPEQEFTINAMEHLRLKNFRLALLEAIIGLEIVLTRYLRTYLSVFKGISKERIKEFLSPQLTLSTRLSGILDLMLSPDDLQHIDRTRVRTAVQWRNDVVHKKGHIPQVPTDSEKTETIFAVLHLTQRLGIIEQQISASPDIRAMVAEIRGRYQDLPFPRIEVLENHRVLVPSRIPSRGLAANHSCASDLKPSSAILPPG
jgi:hypothetical protein